MDQNWYQRYNIIVLLLIILCQLGEILKYEDSKWSEINEVDRVKVTKVEGQVKLLFLKHV